MDLSKLANKIKKQFKDDELKASAIGTGSDMTTPSNPEDYVVMPDWWKDATGLMGLPYGYVFQIAGNTDSGKTSMTIEAMRAAQEQGTQVILVDTEKKTTKARLTSWGVDPDKIARVQPEYLEQAYDGIQLWLDAIKDENPDQKVLVVFDSLGNTPSKAEVDLGVDETMQLGMAAKINKRGFRRIVPRLARERVHLLVINQTYNNLGSPGRSNAGGNSVDYFSALTFQTSRKGWIEGTEKGVKIRKGAKVAWNLYKNHLIDDESKLFKSVELHITKDGIKKA